MNRAMACHESKFRQTSARLQGSPALTLLHTNFIGSITVLPATPRQNRGFTIAVDERTPFQTVYFISQNHTKRNTQRQPYLFFLAPMLPLSMTCCILAISSSCPWKSFFNCSFTVVPYPLVCFCLSGKFPIGAPELSLPDIFGRPDGLPMKL